MMYCVVRQHPTWSGRDVRIRYPHPSGEAFERYANLQLGGTEYPLANPIIVVKSDDTPSDQNVRGFMSDVMASMEHSVTITPTYKDTLFRDVDDLNLRSMIQVTGYVGDPLMHDFGDSVMYPYNLDIMWLTTRSAGITRHYEITNRQRIKAFDHRIVRTYNRKILII